MYQYSMDCIMVDLWKRLIQKPQGISWPRISWVRCGCQVMLTCNNSDVNFYLYFVASFLRYLSVGLIKYSRELLLTLPLFWIWHCPLGCHFIDGFMWDIPKLWKTKKEIPLKPEGMSANLKYSITSQQLIPIFTVCLEWTNSFLCKTKTPNKWNET